MPPLDPVPLAPAPSALAADTIADIASAPTCHLPAAPLSDPPTPTTTHATRVAPAAFSPMPASSLTPSTLSAPFPPAPRACPGNRTDHTTRASGSTGSTIMTPSSSTNHSHGSKVSTDGTDRTDGTDADGTDGTDCTNGSVISANTASTSASVIDSQKTASVSSLVLSPEQPPETIPPRPRSRFGMLSSLLLHGLATAAPRQATEASYTSTPVATSCYPRGASHYELPSLNTCTATEMSTPTGHAGLTKGSSSSQDSPPSSKTSTTRSSPTVGVPTYPAEERYTPVHPEGPMRETRHDLPRSASSFTMSAQRTNKPDQLARLPHSPDRCSPPRTAPHRPSRTSTNRLEPSPSTPASAIPSPNHSSATLHRLLKLGPRSKSECPALPAVATSKNEPLPSPRPSRIPVSKSRRFFASLTMSPAVPKAPKSDLRTSGQGEPKESRPRSKSRASICSVTDIFRRPSSRLSFRDTSRPPSPFAHHPHSNFTAHAQESRTSVARDEIRQAPKPDTVRPEAEISSPPKRPGSSLGNALSSVRRRTMSHPLLLMTSPSMQYTGAEYSKEPSPTSSPLHVRRSLTLQETPVPPGEGPVEKTAMVPEEGIWLSGDCAARPTSVADLCRHSSSNGESPKGKWARGHGLGHNGPARRLSQSMHSVLDFSARLHPSALHVDAPQKETVPLPPSAGTERNGSTPLGPSFVRTRGHRAHRVHQDVGCPPFGHDLTPSYPTGASVSSSSSSVIRPIKSATTVKSSTADSFTQTAARANSWGVGSDRSSSSGTNVSFPLRPSPAAGGRQHPGLLVLPLPRPQRDQGLPAVERGGLEAKRADLASSTDSSLSQSTPAFHIEDDMEFLSAIENVRQHIRAASEQFNQIPRLPPPGHCGRGEQPVRRASMSHASPRSSPVMSRTLSNVETLPWAVAQQPPLRRSKSCGGDLGGEFRTHQYEYDSSSRSPQDHKKDSCVADVNLRPRSWSHDQSVVGHASGKGKQAATLGNEDGWKKEVKALFVIRELILTERSYGRHLECLLAAVKRTMESRVYLQSKSGKDAHRRASAVDLPAPPHVVDLANLLPEMIALSRRLVLQIEANPTAAGVGASFRALSDQLEANFIGWSFAIADIMTGLRSTEHVSRGKAPARGRIGMIYVPPDSSLTSLSRIKGADHLTLPDGSNGSSLVSSTIGTDRVPFPGRPSSPDLPSPTFLSFSVDDDRPNGMGGHRKSSSSLGFYPNARRALTAAVRRNNELSPTSSRVRGPTHAFTNSAGSNQLPSTLTTTTSRTVISPHFDPGMHPSIPAPAYLSKKALSPLDIVIMPTQRLPRYLLLLRDLQRNTPTDSLSYLRLEKALVICRRVADLCDGASYS